MNSDTKLQKLTRTALFICVIFVLTFLVKIPIPLSSGGYVNLGDTAIYIAAALIGGPYAAVAAAIGSSLADVAGGFTLYAPATLLIKAAMGLACGLIVKREGLLWFSLTAIVGGAIMVCGYGLYETTLFGFEYALISAGFNCIQWLGGVIFAVVLYPIIRQLSGVIRDGKVNKRTGSGF